MSKHIWLELETRERSLLAAVLLLPVTLIAVATLPHGPALSPDSTNYLSAAESLATQGELLTVTGGDFVLWPPGLPSVLSVAHFLGISAGGLAVVVNAAATAIIVGCSGYLTFRATGRKDIALLAALVVGASSPIIFVGTFVWTESVFVATTMLMLIALLRYHEDPGTRAALIVGVLAALAFFFRYVGVVNMGVALVAIGAQRRTRDTVIFAVTASVGPFAWIARNLVLTGTAVGERVPPEWGLLRPVIQAGATFGGWLTPSGTPIVLQAAVLLAVAFALVWILWTRTKPSTVEWIVGGYGLAYFGWMLFSAMTTAFDGLNSRTLVPLFPVLVVLLVSSFDASRIRKWTAGVMVLLLAVQAPTTAGQVAALAQTPTGVRAQALSIRDVSASPDMTNGPDAYFAAFGTRVDGWPARTRYNSAVAAAGLEEMTDRLGRDGTVRLLWIEAVERPYLYTPQELNDHFELVLVDAFDAAVLYEARLK